MTSNHRLRILLAAASLGLLAVGCSDEDDPNPSASGDTTSSTAPTTSTTAAQGSPQDSATTVTMTNFAFEPKELKVAKGSLSLQLVNNGSAPHTFTIDSPKVDNEVAAGRNAQALVSLGDAAKEFVFYCRFHRGQGMEGKIVVSEA